MRKFPKKPLIRKLGTIATHVVETTPLVFHDRLYRFEVIRRRELVDPECNFAGNWHDLEEKPCLRFMDVRTNTPTPFFADGHSFGFAYPEGDMMYVVTGSKPHWGSDGLVFYRSTDLVNWEQYAAIDLPGWKTYNMNIAKMGDTYTLMVEISAPVEEAGEYPFTFRFFQSKDMTNWTKLPSEYVFQKDRYCGSPSIYTVEGDPHYYVGYLEGYPEYRFGNSLARSKDLLHWEYSPINPVLMYDEVEDKKIASPFLTPDERKRIDEALDINNSDMELCEFLGRTIIYYSWGDQKGTEFLAEACYEGSMKDFLQGFFEVKE